MAGRCAVETWAEFGCSATAANPSFKSGFGTHVFVCLGSDEVYVFNTPDRKLTGVLQFPAPVSDLVENHDQHLYVACRNGVYCVSLPSLLPRVQSDLADVSSSPAELRVSCECLVVREEGVLSLLVVDSVLLTLSRGDASWVLTVYRTAERSSSYEMLRSLSVPLVSDDSADEKRGPERRPALICVHSGDAPSTPSYFSSGFLSDRHVRLEPALFKLLFGVDAALAKSPVILCGLPDGRLCFLPQRLPGTQLRVLHSLEQPVVFVGASVVTETGSGHALCLVAVGERGRVVVIKTCKGAPEGGSVRAGFTEGCVPGPVVWACVDEQCLYFSTGSDLLALNLSEESCRRESQGWDVEASSRTATGLQSPTSLNVCRLIALTGPTHNTAGDVELLGLSVRGQLQRITLPVGREDAGPSKSLRTQVGRSAGDLLSAIGDVCQRASVLKSAIKSKNQVLQHLNQVLNISFLLIDGANSEEKPPFQEKPIRCHGMTSWSRMLQKDSLNLTCVLDNSSPYFLERGWTLSITVFPLSHSHSPQAESSSTNFSFPFYNLHPGEKLEVSLPLAAADETSFPITVSCALIFSLTSLLGEEEMESLPGVQSSVVSLSLNTLTVDWLHALRVNAPTATHENVISQTKVSTTTDNIQAFLSSRGSRRVEKGEGGAESEQYSASVRVSSDLLRDTLVLKSSDLEPEAPANLCVSLLDWLLSERPGGVKMGHQGDKSVLSGSVIHAQGPNSHTVKLTAKEVNLGVEEESLGIVEVQVESSSVAAVCGLHHAVLRRIQTLVQRAPEKAASTKKVQSLGLRQALQRAERLLQQIQQSRISGAFGSGVSAGQMTRSLLSVYRELRENPLVIF